MKKIITYICFLTLITSCGLFKSHVKSVDNIKNTSTDTLYVNSINIDSAKEIKKEEMKPDEDGEGVADVADGLACMGSNEHSRKANRRPSSIEDKPIEDKTTQDQIINPNLGLVAYSVPLEMIVGKTYTAKLRISKEKNKIELIGGDGDPISDVTIDSKITIASIRVEPIMSSSLISDSSKMIIQNISSQTQDIDKDGFTEWEWRLTPIKGGDVLLRIVVDVIDPATKVKKDIPVYDKVIKVKSNLIYDMGCFVKDYWQWLITTIVLPFIIWFYNKRRKEKES